MCIVFGFVLILSGILLIFYGNQAWQAQQNRMEDILFHTVTRSIQDKNYLNFAFSSSFSFEMDAPEFTSFYLFNLTNPIQVLSSNDDNTNGNTNGIIMKQIGPYTYERKSRKVNVEFETIPDTSLYGYGQVSYQVVSDFVFVPERSNGTDEDLVMTLNTSYARKLSILKQFGYTEGFLLGEFAQRHLQEYSSYLENDFLNQTKQRALQFYLPTLYTRVQKKNLPVVLKSQKERFDGLYLTDTVTQMEKIARIQMVPSLLKEVIRNLSDSHLPVLLETQFNQAKRQAMPRVLSNMKQRLLVESVPFFLREQLDFRLQQHVPITLKSLYDRLNRLAMPYVLKEIYDQSCMDMIPSIISSLKSEIIARDMKLNKVMANVAQFNVVETWRLPLAKGASAMDLDAFIDDSPTQSPRRGFELCPPNASVTLSYEAASLLLGSSSNKRFSILEYDSYFTDGAYFYPWQKDTLVTGFDLWKQVLALNETAISYLVEGVNNDIALKADFLTRQQVLFIRSYLLEWSTSDLIQRDRERFWREKYTKRSLSSSIKSSEPEVDLEFEQQGLQTGFSLSTTGISKEIAQVVWNISSDMSFVNNGTGITTWLAYILDQDTSAEQKLQQALVQVDPTFTTQQLSIIGNWLKSLYTNGFIKRRALRQWAVSTEWPSNLLYDLDPMLDRGQLGFELTTASNVTIILPSTRAILWDVTSSVSFLSDTVGFPKWVQAHRNLTARNDLLKEIQQITQDLTFESSQLNQVLTWLIKWQENLLNKLAVYEWWRLEDKQLMSTTLPSIYHLEDRTIKTLTSGTDGFELSTTLPANSPQRVSTAVVAYLWNVSNEFSFLNINGYQAWIEFKQPLDIVKAINHHTKMMSCPFGHDMIFSGNSNFTGGDANSGDFNTTIAINCGFIDMDQLNHVKTWIQKQSSTKWIQQALYEQWRQGLKQHKEGLIDGFDLEPYREGLQTGFELEMDPNHLVSLQDIASLWDSKHPASFLHGNGYTLWYTLLKNDSTSDTISKTKDTIATHLGRVQWENWMQSVVEWLKKWQNQEYFLRDVLGHWLFGTCPLMANEMEEKVIISDTSVENDVPTAQCQPSSTFEFTQASDITAIEQLEAQASRSTIFFRGTFAEDTALGQLKKVVEVKETMIVCQVMTQESTKVKKKTRTKISQREYSTCHWLQVLDIARNGQDSFDANSFWKVKQDLIQQKNQERQQQQEEPRFEFRNLNVDLNKMVSSSTQKLLIEKAFSLWLNNETTWINATIFQNDWLSLLRSSEPIEKQENWLVNDLLKPLVTQIQLQNINQPNVLKQIVSYLSNWEQSQLSLSTVGSMWTSTKFDASLMDGFQILTSISWYDNAAQEKALTIKQALYLLDASAAWSFLNDKGFHQWLKIFFKYEKYPQIDTISLSQDQKDLLNDLISVTGLTEKQCKGIAGWLFEWSDRSQLKDFVSRSWMQLSGQVQKAPIHFSSVLTDTALWTQLSGGLKGAPLTSQADSSTNDIFEFPSVSVFGDRTEIFANWTLSMLRSLWDPKFDGSFLNPSSQVVWCLVDISVYTPSLSSIPYCPHVYNVTTNQVLLDMELALLNQVSSEPITSIQLDPKESETDRQKRLDNLSRNFLQSQLNVDSTDTIQILAGYFRGWIPKKMFLYQLIQMNRWAASTSPSKTNKSNEVAWMGYTLDKVFPTDTSILRDISSSKILQDNLIITSDSNGKEMTKKWIECDYPDLDFAFELWNESSSVSFATLFTKEDDIKPSIDNMNSLKSGWTLDQKKCTLDGVSNWLYSWLKHPVLKEYTEKTWLGVVPSSLDQSLQGFYLDTTTISYAERVSLLSLARKVWDFSLDISLLNETVGFPKWRTIAFSSPSTVFLMISSLKQGQSIEVDDEKLLKFIQQTMVPWLESLLNSKELGKFLLEEIHVSTEDLTELKDLSYIQFVNASVATVEYSLATISLQNIGLVTLADSSSNSSSISVEAKDLRLLRRDLKPFCMWSSNATDGEGVEFAYDQSLGYLDCHVDTLVSLNTLKAQEFLQVFGDNTTVTLTNGYKKSYNTTRGALLLDAFLNQPFHEEAICQAKRLQLTEILLSEDIVCQKIEGQGDYSLKIISSNIPAWLFSGHSSASALTVQLQKYLRYSATKFIYEPLVLGLHGPTLSSNSHQTLIFPVGGLVALDHVKNVLFGRINSLESHQIGGMLKDVFGASSASFMWTFQVPLHDLTYLFTNDTYKVGQLLAINQSTSIMIGGDIALDFRKKAVTDGSQFTSQMMMGKTNGTSLSTKISGSPPDSLIFYWPILHRLVKLKYSRLVSRYGVPLYRYNISSYALPDGFPTGVSLKETFTNVSDLSNITAKLQETLVNMSHVALDDSFSLLLSTPHFLGIYEKDEKSFEELFKLKGLRPSMNLHESVIDVEPITGVVYHQKLNYQLNYLVSSDAMDTWHSKMSSFLLPLVWIRQFSSVKEKKAKDFSDAIVFTSPFAEEKVATWQVACGVVYIIVGLCLAWFYGRRQRWLKRRLKSVKEVVPAPSPLILQKVEVQEKEQQALDEVTPKSFSPRLAKPKRRLSSGSSFHSPTVKEVTRLLTHLIDETEETESRESQQDTPNSL